MSQTATSYKASTSSSSGSSGLLLPYQQRWIWDESNVKVCVKSRRIGLSWAEACSAVELASWDEGCNVWYVSYNVDSTREFIQDCASWAKVYQIAGTKLAKDVLPNDKSVLTYSLTFATGYRITALSSNSANLRGKAGKVIIDEAAFAPDLSGLLKAAIALTIWGGQISVISTYNGTDNHFYRLVQDIKAGKLNYSLHDNLTFDKAIEEGLYRRICVMTRKKWSAEGERKWRQDIIDRYGDDAEEELFCIPRSASANYLPELLVRSRMKEEFVVRSWRVEDPFMLLEEWDRKGQAKQWFWDYITPIISALPKKHRKFIGMDFARSQHMTSIALIVEEEDLHRNVPLILELSNVPFEQQFELLIMLAEGVDFLSMAIDKGGNGQYLAERAEVRWGAGRVQAIHLSDDKYREMMPRYKSALEDKEISLPKHANVLKDHELVKVIGGVPKLLKRSVKGGDGGQKRHGDSVIALMLGNWVATCKTYQTSKQKEAPFPKHEVSASKVRDIFAVESSKMAVTSRRFIRGRMFGG